MVNSNLKETIRLQQQASNPENSVWVFASAGSGKTKILTDRVLRLLLADVAPSKILCLTFTRVAASEMQNRINSELVEWILHDEEKLQQKLHDLSGNFPSKKEIQKAQSLLIKTLDDEFKIKVQTIHSFCQNLIRIFPFEAKVRPNFEVMETVSEKLMLQDVQTELLRSAANNPNNLLQDLIKKINAKLNDEGFSELVSKLLSRKEDLNFLKEKFFGMENVIAKIFQDFGVNPDETSEKIFTDFLSQINLEKTQKLSSILDNSGSARNEDIAISINEFLKNQKYENFFSYRSAFFTLENKPRKIYGKIAEDPDLLESMADQQKLILEFSDKFNSLEIANDTALLLRFVDHVLQNYDLLKRHKGLLDYNDLIYKTNKLLAEPDFADWVKMKMDGTFDHILIDESQDTNHKQWNIVKALSDDFFSGMSSTDSKRSIFIVGDEKQSIYSFQGAEPNISAEIFSYFDKKLAGKLQKIELNNSFRSTRSVLEAVDLVFSDPGRKNAISKISEFTKHHPIRSGSGKVEIWPQVKKEKEAGKAKDSPFIKFDSSEENEEKEILAKMIAKKIIDSIAEGRILESTVKPVSYGDFMILLRNRTNGFAEILTKVFTKNSIPFSAISRIKFSKSLVIQDLLSAARFALLNRDDLNLACLLKSPFFAISEEDLLELCAVRNERGIALYAALDYIEKFQDIKKSLVEISKKSLELNCFDFFYFLLHVKEHDQKFMLYFGDEARVALDEFSLFVLNFCENFSDNLQKFLEFVILLDPEISLSANDQNRVRITTIHSSKGLESPIVVLPDCCYNANQLLATKESISWLDGIPIWCRKKEFENQILKNHRKDKIKEVKEEYLRLLYVAMTRAEDELYVGGFGDSRDEESWYEVVRSCI